MNTNRTTPVWDRFIRLFHWALVVAVSTGAITGFVLGAPWAIWHIAAGGLAVALVLARIVWGLTGPGAALFVDFLPRPREVIAHLRGQGGRHLGHNPLGALMVLALLAAVLALGVSGLVGLGGALKTGPLARLSQATGATALALHEAAALGLMALVALHLGGVAFESWRSRENLAGAMVTGRKPLRPGDRWPALRPGRAGVAVGLGLALAAGLGAAGWALAQRPATGLPVADWDSQTRAECTACHMAYHPSLLPAESWRALMATLPDHFGEDASLPEADRAAIEGWLVATAAETVDTRPAALLRPSPAAPFTMTESPGWQRLHAALPDGLFDRKPILSKANCAACHGDAETGLFSPFALNIPKEIP